MPDGKRLNHLGWCRYIRTENGLESHDCTCGAWRKYREEQKAPSVRFVYSRSCALQSKLSTHMVRLKSAAADAAQTGSLDELRGIVGQIEHVIAEFKSSLDISNVHQTELQFTKGA